MKSQYGLVFYPLRLDYQPKNTEPFISKLQAQGFLGESFQAHGHSGYLIGEDFLKLLTFLGCAPHIEIAPPEQLSNWVNFCYVEIRQFQQPHYFKGLNKPKCSCPHCRSRVVNALPDMSQWLPGTLTLTCPKCQQSVLAEALNWRHGAGFGQFFIMVNSVYPSEAVPTDKLMALLHTISNEHWDYFYFEQ